MSAVLSADLGTSNTVAVLSAHGRPPRAIEVDGTASMPSAVLAAVLATVAGEVSGSWAVAAWTRSA